MLIVTKCQTISNYEFLWVFIWLKIIQTDAIMLIWILMKNPYELFKSKKERTHVSSLIFI